MPLKGEPRKERKKQAQALSSREGLNLNYAYLVVDGTWTLEEAKSHQAQRRAEQQQKQNRREQRREQAQALAQKERLDIGYAYQVIDGALALEEARKRQLQRTAKQEAKRQEQQEKRARRAARRRAIADIAAREQIPRQLAALVANERLNPEEARARYHEERESAAIVFCDGICEPNPGHAGLGVYITDPYGRTLIEAAEYLGRGTNNIAEYQAVIRGIEKARELGKTKIHVKTDSQLVVFQVTGRWGVNTPHLFSLYRRARALLKETKATIEWIPREQNTKADRLSRKALTAARESARQRREKKAKELAVKPTPHPGRFQVQSASTPFLWYEVDISLPSCSCPDFVSHAEKHECKHILAVRAFAAGTSQDQGERTKRKRLEKLEELARRWLGWIRQSIEEREEIYHRGVEVVEELCTEIVTLDPILGQNIKEDLSSTLQEHHLQLRQVTDRIRAGDKEALLTWARRHLTAEHLRALLKEANGKVSGTKTELAARVAELIQQGKIDPSPILPPPGPK